MKVLDVKSLVIPDIKVISYHHFADDRGFFTETFRESDLTKVIPNFQIKQVNESFSKKGVLRGLHFQWNPYMAKLIRAISGKIIDFFLDIRLGSPTFGKISGYELSSQPTAGKNEWILIPVGFAHGILILEDSTIEYLCTSEYSPGCEAGISPLSQDIDWSIADKNVKKKLEELKKSQLIISEKDKEGLTLKQWQKDERSKNFQY
ncbi:dTDP-4-dehydrorhamnose 3,5-epimerase [Candidatus Roizmanbacteria bacterium CG02_land_8_20_14_3_00_36_15]|uniref:dTDP-4-dehydrorhamnose 3,5-epimerase n=2 Tax=Candidatus Roizmaniibacteriota TaxID=1752723 RepID=A0A2M8KJN7_9BACT|nr:MAG: dTDP-4-dehydrorhamnose 3,5-epimerase [Candidatus Roizmanbacteria bacterium CG03_land_8_20_14_0_80_36_21]PIV37355.1 MAG: dTDP-4-dehydrorhamnose 3,5-epimerase [Candidatus Roizmanbacteria bacterium CG02_land_8_20_14_3_00_36_15]PJA53620.1 MAG: dTDP-4-dehydrorhamnose 3,5-epimerase [Candidatus Roizmanbacteria bacterium CG_4_9_14_3_um_filter_36_11]PJC81310.1 MAG: dTDP-4-dehydrorhamnose 3,5-epimerase [Candidatus Roizmanbacteria bacterium CG_4_8_14_3_um_filter_36_10]PJE60137.1 MAG: dTDP-4-dehydr